MASAATCLKVTYKITNLVLLLIGLATVGLGIYLLVDWYKNTDTNTQVNVFLEKFSHIPHFIIAVLLLGVLTVFRASVGLCGVDCCCCCWSLYVLFTLLILFGEIMIIIIVFKQDAQELEDFYKEIQIDVGTLPQEKVKDVAIIQCIGIGIVVLEIIALIMVGVFRCICNEENEKFYVFRTSKSHRVYRSYSDVVYRQPLVGSNYGQYEQMAYSGQRGPAYGTWEASAQTGWGPDHNSGQKQQNYYGV